MPMVFAPPLASSALKKIKTDELSYWSRDEFHELQRMTFIAIFDTTKIWKIWRAGLLHWVDPSRQSKITEALATVQPVQRSRTQKTEYYIVRVRVRVTLLTLAWLATHPSRRCDTRLSSILEWRQERQRRSIPMQQSKGGKSAP